MRLRSGRVSSRERTILYYTKQPKKNYKNTIHPDSPGQRPEEKSLMSETVTLNTTPQGVIANDIEDLLNQESPSARANLNKQTNVNQEEDINKESQQNPLIAKTLVDENGHVLQLETAETIHSRDTLRKSIETPKQSKDSPERKSSETGTISKEHKTPSINKKK